MTLILPCKFCGMMALLSLTNLEWSSEDLVNENLGCGHRECRPLSKLKDYICHIVNCVKDPTPKLHPSSQSSSILYPITNYFLATITYVHEPS
ncbi:hypothetical protein CR513_26850, partial [Mucuna pruriens]